MKFIIIINSCHLLLQRSAFVFTSKLFKLFIAQVLCQLYRFIGQLHCKRTKKERTWKFVQMFKQHLNGSLYILGLQLLNGNSMSYWSFEWDNCTVTELQKICLNPTPHPHLSSAIHPTSSLGLLKSLEEGFMFLFGFHTRWSQIKISSSIYILCFILLENYSVFLNF